MSLGRTSLVPYLYSAAWRAHNTGTLPLHPLYYDWPDEEQAYTFSRFSVDGTGGVGAVEYAFGDAMVVAPVLRPSGAAGAVAQRVWVPPGSWSVHQPAPDPLILHVALPPEGGSAGDAEVYEDGGVDRGYARGEYGKLLWGKRGPPRRAAARGATLPFRISAFGPRNAPQSRSSFDMNAPPPKFHPRNVPTVVVDVPSCSTSAAVAVTVWH
eukprot:gene2864-65062_t